MTSSLSRRRAAWAVPVVVAVAAAVVTAAVVVPGPASASAHPDLPPVSAADLLTSVATSSAQALSGTVVETARLGLPELPGAGQSASFDWQALVTGSHTARVWVDGPDHQRLALLGTLSESDVVRSGRDVWTYASDAQAVTHLVLPDDGAGPSTAPAEGGPAVLTPAAAAAKVLAAVDPTTVVTVDRTAEVAGRPAYTLVLTPRDTRSTVRRVQVAVDSATRVPLRVQVFGAAAAPAFETGFTDVSFSRPAASVFRFTPPSGSTVAEQSLPARGPEADAATARSAGTGARVVGTGWTSVLVLPAGSAGAAGPGGGLLDRLTTTQPDGDRLITTSLVSVLLTTDGRVLLGAVSPELLSQVASGAGR